MAIVEKNIHRSKIGRELYFPLKYSDVESCFTHFDADPIYLSVWFGGYVNYDKEHVARIRTEGRMLIWGKYNVDFANWKLSKARIEEPVISITVYALQHEIAKEFYINRLILRGALDRLTQIVVPHGLKGDSWWFSIDFAPDDEPCLVCRHKLWVGLREGEEKSFRVTLKPDEIQS